MLRKFLSSILLVFLLFALGCSKKQHPQSSIKVTDYPGNVKVDSANTVNKPAERKVVKRAVTRTPIPKVITVDDRAAHTTAEGRKYYDLEGKRYWRNFNDGKYYLYHTGLFDDAAFKPH